MAETLGDQPVRDRGSGQFVLACFVIVIAATGAGILLALGVYSVREAAYRSQCICPLAQIRHALLNYHDVCGSLPPAYVPDANGKPMHSWRVLILPFLEERDVYARSDFHEPWNGPNNRRLADKIRSELFQCPRRRHSRDSLITDYVVVVGNDTMFPGAQSRSIKDITDGVENTIAVVEINNSDIHWMEPRDLQFEEMSFIINDPSSPSISSEHAAGPHVVFLNRKTKYVKGGAVRPQTVRALLTANGREEVFTKDLERLDPRTRSWCLAEETQPNH